MKRILLLSLFLLVGCANNKIPPMVMPDFPKAPSDLMLPAPELATLPDDKNALSDLLENAADNYGKFYMLKDKYEAWQQWYQSQEKIWDGLKKQ